MTTNDYALVNTYSVNIVVSFVNTSYTSTIIQNLSVKLLHPCTSTEINPPIIPAMIFLIGDEKYIADFVQMTDSTAI